MPSRNFFSTLVSNHVYWFKPFREDSQVKTLRIVATIALVVFLAGTAMAAEQASPPAQPNMPGSWMSIPWGDFKEILEKLADGQDLPDPPPPCEAVIGAARYNAQVGPSGVEVSASADILVLKKTGWVSVPIIQSGVPISEVTLDGKPSALSLQGGMLHLPLEGFGQHTLNLKYVLELSKNSGPEQFLMPAVRAQVNRLVVKLPAPDMVLKTSPQGYMESQTTGGATVAVGSFPPADRVSISWARSVPKAVKETARISAEVRTMLTVGEGLGVYTSIIDYTIHHKPISEFRMILPADVSVADVSTEGLVDWKVNKTEAGQELTVSIAFEAVGRHQVAVTFETMLPGGEDVSIKTADLVVQNVVHEVGFLAVAVRTNIQVSPKEGSLVNLAQLDPSELPADLRGSGDQKVLYGFKYIKHPSAMELNVIKHKDASVLTCEVEVAHYRIMVTDKGKQLIEATYRIANRSLQYLTLTLPPGSDLWGVYREGQPIKAAEADGKILLPVFKGGLHKTFTMKVLAYRKSGSFLPVGHKGIELPILDAGASKVFLELYLPTRFRSFGYGGSLRRTYAASPLAGPADVNGKLSMTKNVSDLRSSGEDLDQMDDGELGWNKQYRKDRSQVQQNIANVPILAENAAYLGNYARGALPVEFDITWEGSIHRFATNIVDPGEKNNVRFFYSRRSRSSIFRLLMVVLAGFIGYLVAATAIGAKSKYVARPSKNMSLYGVVALGVILVLGIFCGYQTFTLGIGFLIGVLIICVRLLIGISKAAPKAKPRMPAPKPPEPEPPTAEPVDRDPEGGRS